MILFAITTNDSGSTPPGVEHCVCRIWTVVLLFDADSFAWAPPQGIHGGPRGREGAREREGEGEREGGREREAECMILFAVTTNDSGSTPPPLLPDLGREDALAETARAVSCFCSQAYRSGKRESSLLTTYWSESTLSS